MSFGCTILGMGHCFAVVGAGWLLPGGWAIYLHLDGTLANQVYRRWVAIGGDQLGQVQSHVQSQGMIVGRVHWRRRCLTAWERECTICRRKFIVCLSG